MDNSNKIEKKSPSSPTGGSLYSSGVVASTSSAVAPKTLSPKNSVYKGMPVKPAVEEKPPTPSVVQFDPLSSYDVEVNLGFLADIKEGDKIMLVDGKYMQVENRYISSVRRFFTADSRSTTIQFIHHVVKVAEDLCRDAVVHVQNNEDKQKKLQDLIKMQSLLRSACTGLGRLIATYSDDKLHRSMIEAIRDEIIIFCNEDIKKVTGV